MTESFQIRVERRGSAFDLLSGYGGSAGFFMQQKSRGVASSSAAVKEASAGASTRSELRRLSAAAVASLRESGTSAAIGAGVPLATGVIPFEPTSPATLRIPRVAVRRDDDVATWAIHIEEESDGPERIESERVVGSAPHDAFRPVQLREEPSAEDYASMVSEAVDAIRSGALEKIVLARTLAVDAGRRLDARRLVHRLRAVEPHCYTFAAPAEGGTLVGASPELLLERRGAVVRSNPLAGSAPRSGDPDEDRASAQALEDSGKDREEHAFVVAAVAEILGDLCDDLAYDPEPVLLATANVWHLSTRFRGTLRDPNLSALDVVAELHPTPAVCGTPTHAARDAIAAAEPFDRGPYAGPVGWLDANGDGVWAIALRCAELEGTRARLFAGAGIVAGSDPMSEVEETDRKFRAFLDSLRWG